MLGRGNGQVGGQVPQTTTRRALCSGNLYGTFCSKVLISTASSCRGRGGRVHCSFLRLRLRVMRLLRQCLFGFSWPRRAPALGKGASGLLMLPNCPLFSAPPQPLLSSIQKLLLGTLATLTLP